MFVSLPWERYGPFELERVPFSTGDLPAKTFVLLFESLDATFELGPYRLLRRWQRQSSIGDSHTLRVHRDRPGHVEAAAARVRRSQGIHEPGHRYVFLIEEAVLYYQLGNAEAMAAQLGYLLTAGALPQVSFGIVPTATRERSMWPKETFHVHDDTLASVELVSAEVNITQPSEIALYVKAFEQLRSMAVYGAEARALIVKAIDALG